jgi:serine protease Do
MTSRASAGVCMFFMLGACAAASASALTPHRPVAVLGLAASREFIAESGQGLPSFPEIVDAVKPSVIGVRTRVAPVGRKDTDQHRSGLSADQFIPFGAPEDAPNLPDEHQMLMSQGSGFFISADGYAVTNGHVVEGSDTAEIKTDDGKTYTAKIVGTDPVTDLALLKVDGDNDFTPVRLADQVPRVGEWVLAIGNPFGLDGTVTAGVVSAGKRNVGADISEDLIQIDAPVNQGNSGGPTFDIDGRVIGINTMVVSPTGGSIGIAFAIPADTLKSVIPQLREKGFVTRGWIGVQFQPASPTEEGSVPDRTGGVTVAEVQANSPAAAAGITPGDVIRSVNGEPSAGARDLVKRIRNMRPGTSVDLGVLRKGQDKVIQEKVIAVTLGELPVKRQARAKQEQERKMASPAAAGLGLKLAPARTTSSPGGSGVVITGIDPNGSAIERGLSSGDVIIKMAGEAVNTPGEVRDALDKARREGKRFVLMQVRSGETTRFVAVPADS